MRKLDELLQDIPLDELMGRTGSSTEQPVEADKQPSGKRVPIKLKSRLPAIFTAAALAVIIGVGVLVISLKHSDITPGTASENVADPIGSLTTEEISLGLFENVGDKYKASLVFTSMRKYSAEYRSQTGRPFHSGELFLDLESSADKDQQLITSLEHYAERRLSSGYAYFLFDENGSLCFAEWCSDENSKTYCYTKNKKYYEFKVLGTCPSEFDSVCDDMMRNGTNGLSWKYVRLIETGKDKKRTLLLNRTEALFLFRWLEQTHISINGASSALPDEKSAEFRIEYMSPEGSNTVLIDHDDPSVVSLNGQAVSDESMNRWLITGCMDALGG